METGENPEAGFPLEKPATHPYAVKTGAAHIWSWEEV